MLVRLPNDSLNEPFNWRLTTGSVWRHSLSTVFCTEAQAERISFFFLYDYHRSGAARAPPLGARRAGRGADLPPEADPRAAREARGAVLGGPCSSSDVVDPPPKISMSKWSKSRPLPRVPTRSLPGARARCLNAKQVPKKDGGEFRGRFEVWVGRAGDESGRQ